VLLVCENLRVLHCRQRWMLRFEPLERRLAVLTSVSTILLPAAPAAVYNLPWDIAVCRYPIACATRVCAPLATWRLLRPHHYCYPATTTLASCLAAALAGHWLLAAHNAVATLPGVVSP